MDNETRFSHIFQNMIAIRRFEEEVIGLHDAEEFSGHYHLYIGQEATGSTVMESLGPEDRIFSTHRNHGHLIARGADPSSAMAEILGRSTGLNGGRGGTFHLANPELGMPHTSALVGGAVPLAAGGALAAKIKKTGGIGVSMFGDGCFEEGLVFETLNLARLWHLPVIFICENNTPGAVLKSAGGTNSSNMPSGRVLDTPAALGMEAYEVDGGDAEAVNLLFQDCINRVRANGEPIFIEALTERWPGNYYSFPSLVTGATELTMIWDDSLIDGEHEDWFRTHDPIFRLGRALLANEILTQEEILKIDREATDTMQKAREFALASPLPSTEKIYEHVLAGGEANA